MKKEKIISIVCLTCGRKYRKKNKDVMGVWFGTCDICKEEGIPVADAGHDFAIFSTKDIELKDKMQDLL